MAQVPTGLSTRGGAAAPLSLEELLALMGQMPQRPEDVAAFLSPAQPLPSKWREGYDQGLPGDPRLTPEGIAATNAQFQQANGERIRRAFEGAIGQDPLLGPLYALGGAETKLLSGDLSPITDTVQGLWNNASLPARVMTGEFDTGPARSDSPEEYMASLDKMDALTGESLNFAANLAGAGGAVPKPENSLGIFGGRRAKTADLDMLARAMEETGKRPRGELYPQDIEDIFALTGWFPGADNKWRFEIPDYPTKGTSFPDADAAMQMMVQEGLDNGLDPLMAKMRARTEIFRQKVADPNVLREGDTRLGQPARTLPDFMSHPELYAAYPELKDTTATINTHPMIPYGGEHAPANVGTKYPVISAQAPTNDELMSILLHETQHGVQQIEGFAGGGNVNWMGQKLAELVPRADHQLRFPNPKDIYKALMGEVEARNVQKRWLDGTRQNSPLMVNPTRTEDTPLELQINPMWMDYPEGNVQLPPGYKGSPADYMREQLLSLKYALSMQELK